MLGALALWALCAFGPTSSYALHRQPNSPLTKRQPTLRSTNYPANYIEQPIDHFPASDRYLPHTNATFKQRYYFDSSYYKPGGPVYLFLSGETDGSSRFYALQNGIIQILMSETNGLGVILENRYYGESYPFNSSTTDELRFLTTEQTIADNAYFAQHANFSGIGHDLTAPGTPWILYGGSLAGAQTAFSVVQYGGASKEKLIWGGIAASAPVHPVLAYSDWYSPVQKFAPQDCVARINEIVDKTDALLQSGNKAAVQQLKNIFGLGALTDDRDFAATIAFPLGGPLNYPTSTWQEINWLPYYDPPDFWQFCDNVTNADAPANATAVDNALAKYSDGKAWLGLGNYAAYVKNVLLPLCPSPSLLNTNQCFGTQNATYWAEPANAGLRSYLYSTCTEQGAYQVAPPTGPSLISRVLQVNYTQQWCKWAFPPGKFNRIPESPDLSQYTRYGDFNISAPRLAFIDGNVDAWKDVTYHSDHAPLRTDAEAYLIAGAGHHWDSYGILDVASEPDYIREAHKWEIRTVQRWLRDWKA